MGAVTPIGLTVTAFWDSLVVGTSGIGLLSGPDMGTLAGLPVGQIHDFDETSRLGHWQRDRSILLSDRYSWLAAAAADEAIQQSGLTVPFSDPFRVACIIGSGAGGQTSGERGCRNRFVHDKRAVHPFFLPRIIASSASAHIGIQFGVKGPTYAVMSAGASAAHAIGLGTHYIRSGLCDVAIVGGSDSPLTVGALLACQSLRVLSPTGCFPFSARRNGMVLAEGAGVLVLESERHAAARGAQPLAAIAGFGMTAGAVDFLGLDVEAASAAMGAALRDANLPPSVVGYINAHGIGTVSSDRDETRAVKTTFGAEAHTLAVSSTKSMYGHPFGASGALGAVVCIKAMETGWLPPTIGLSDPDASCDLDYIPNIRRRREVAYGLANSFGLGGFNAALLLAASSTLESG
jgi:nodulation protein E